MHQHFAACNWKLHFRISFCISGSESHQGYGLLGLPSWHPCGWQGSGKSTLVEQLVALLKHTGVTAVDVSIDDFYLTFQV